jgi:membrane protease YdiL (CAAX protease family)
LQIPRNNKPNLKERLTSLSFDATTLVLFTFVLLQIFRLIHLLITSRTLEGILAIPFQLTVFLIPTYLFARYRDPHSPLTYISRLRMRLPSAFQIPLIVSAIPLISCGCLLMSIMFGGTRSLSDGFTLYNTFVSGGGSGFFGTVFVILAYAVVPAICEELVFRGVLCREFERYSPLSAILISSIFFALLHFDVALFPVYLFAGILLSLSMYATGSVIVPMIIHFFYNAIALFGHSFISAFYEVTGGSSGLFTFIILMLTLLFAALFCRSAAKSYQKRAAFSKIPNRPIIPPSNVLIGAVSNVLLTPWSIASVCFYIVVVILYSLF